ncbi:hypothetical protein [Arthrobacter sp. H5]|uniref:hypothetical protein n=1 Tax=Arthrobacter sp. H5 TaxID=1267973 RepID=UPI000488F3A6|nr:hypothetical protein [Arthrobacter sp. H5]
MDLSAYVSDLQEHLAIAAEAGGGEARALAERLTAPLESATRLVLLEALSAAAGEITRELAPGAVDVRLRGRDPEFVVTQPADQAFAEVAERVTAPRPRAADPGDIEDGATSRTTLRLPDHLKARVEESASREAISVNAWLVRAVTTALDPGSNRAARSEPRGGGEGFTGWVR